MEFAWKTRTEKTSVNGLPRVFFCSGKKAYDDNFDVLSGDILEYVNCVIYHVDYENIPGSMSELTDELVDDLQEMQIIVVPVTKELFTEEDAWVRDVIKAVKGKKIILPIMMGEVDLWNEFEPLFGSVQFLDKYNLYGQAKGTEISYEKKLEKRLKEFLVGDELAAKVREAFDAKIFLSYRKKDRREAQELMRLIHSDPKCESIAIWYDEFLVPGEDYNEDIKKALESSNALVFNVTQSFNEPGNYVLRVEYPAAQEQEKKIISVEMSDTDIDELEHNFKGIGDSLIKIDKHEEVCKVTLDALTGLVKDENSNDMKHTFFLGLAYKNGLEVEVDDERGNRLIERAAEGGLPEAMEEMARLCFYVRNEFETAIDWQRKAVEAFKGVIESDDDGMDAFLGFQRAVMNVMSMAKETGIDVSEWVYAIVEDVAAGYFAKVKEQPEKYREQFVKMQYLRIEVVRWYTQQNNIWKSEHKEYSDYLMWEYKNNPDKLNGAVKLNEAVEELNNSTEKIQYINRVNKKKMVAVIKKDVDEWAQLCKETNSNQDSTKGSLEDEQLVVDIYCTIGDRTGCYIVVARNKITEYLCSVGKEFSDKQKCEWYIKYTKLMAKYEECSPNCGNNKIGLKYVENTFNWFNIAQAALEMCDAHKENGKLDKEWGKLYWNALYVITSQLIKVAKVNLENRIEDDLKDKIEEYINDIYNNKGSMFDNGEGDDAAEQCRTVIDEMIRLLIAKIELDNQANSTYIEYLKTVLDIAKDMTKRFKDRKSRKFYVKQLVYCAESVLWVKKLVDDAEGEVKKKGQEVIVAIKELVDDAEREARELCEKENTVQTKEWLKRAIKSKCLVVGDESEKNELEKETEDWTSPSKKYRIDKTKKRISDLQSKYARYDNKLLLDWDDNDKWKFAEKYYLPKYNKKREYDKANLEIAKEDFKELKEISEVLSNEDLYKALFKCLEALKSLDYAKEIYEKWNAFAEENYGFCKYIWENMGSLKFNAGIGNTMQQAIKKAHDFFEMKCNVECIMAESYEHAEDYEGAKIYWKKVAELETEIAERYKITKNIQSVEKWENERKNTEERIAACDEKLKG